MENGQRARGCGAREWGPLGSPAHPSPYPLEGANPKGLQEQSRASAPFQPDLTHSHPSRAGFKQHIPPRGGQSPPSRPSEAAVLGSGSRDESPPRTLSRLRDAPGAGDGSFVPARPAVPGQDLTRLRLPDARRVCLLRFGFFRFAFSSTSLPSAGFWGAGTGWVLRAVKGGGEVPSPPSSPRPPQLDPPVFGRASTGSSDSALPPGVGDSGPSSGSIGGRTQSPAPAASLPSPALTRHPGNFWGAGGIQGAFPSPLPHPAHRCLGLCSSGVIVASRCTGRRGGAGR